MSVKISSWLKYFWINLIAWSVLFALFVWIATCFAQVSLLSNIEGIFVSKKNKFLLHLLWDRSLWAILQLILVWTPLSQCILIFFLSSSEFFICKIWDFWNVVKACKKNAYKIGPRMDPWIVPELILSWDRILAHRAACFLARSLCAQLHQPAAPVLLDISWVGQCSLHQMPH